MYGGHVGIGSLTPFIDSAFDSRIERCDTVILIGLASWADHRAKSIILDGEMLVWDPVSERNLPFGTLKTAALGTTVTIVVSRIQSDWL